MASPTPRKNSSQGQPSFSKYPPRPPAGPPEVVDPIWLLKAIGLTILAALVCGYASLCLLLYQGQWQLLLHPSQTTAHPSQLGGAPVEFLRFGPDESGVPQRTAWMLPAGPGARYANTTVLYLPSGDGSLADATGKLALLRGIGINVFATEYRGYGESAAGRPSQVRMTGDARAAWQYLTTSRGIPEGHIVLYGTGLGTSLATALAAGHPGAPALILDSPAPDPLQTVLADPRTHLLPVRLLLHDRFPLAGPLVTLKTPKLLLSAGPENAAFRSAADPKITVELPLGVDTSSTTRAEAMTRFLDQVQVR